MGDPDRGVGGVDALAAGAGGAVDVDAQLALVDVDVVGGLDDREHLDAGEGGLPAAWLSKGEMRTRRWVPCSTERVP
ncbi:hypothetical protein GCM10020229_24840 [Kitasatospora albolonga]